MFHSIYGRREMTVGKSFVAGVMRGNKEEIQRKRRQLKHRVPRNIPKNTIWALNLTTIDDHLILGVIDHGTRACLKLSAVPDKTVMAILRSILDLIERFGRPNVLRTDNEAMFRSSFFSLIVKMLGIRHRRTMLQAAWQNGRIERFFGTLKSALRLRPDTTLRPGDLDDFRIWYNHAHPHQHLEGRAPAEAWDPPSNKSSGAPRFFSTWAGLLTGFVP